MFCVPDILTQEYWRRMRLRLYWFKPLLLCSRRIVCPFERESKIRVALFLQGWRKYNFWYCGRSLTPGVDLLMKSFRCLAFAVALSQLLRLTTKVSPRACLHNFNYTFQWLWREFTQQILFIVWFLSVLETCIILFIKLFCCLGKIPEV